MCPYRHMSYTWERRKKKIFWLPMDSINMSFWRLVLLEWRQRSNTFFFVISSSQQTIRSSVESLAVFRDSKQQQRVDTDTESLINPSSTCFVCNSNHLSHVLQCCLEVWNTLTQHRPSADLGTDGSSGKYYLQLSLPADKAHAVKDGLHMKFTVVQVMSGVKTQLMNNVSFETSNTHLHI